MLGSFYILSDEGRENISLKELHANLWFFNKKKAFLDVGLWYEFEKDFFFSKDFFKFTIYTPFSIKEKVKSLFETMSEDKIMRLLHNEDIDIQSSGETQSPYKIVKFNKSDNREYFVLLDADLSESTNCNKFDLTINHKDSKNELKKKLDENSLQDKTKIGIYVRFRYFIDLPKTSNITINKDFYHEKILVDLRLNDERSVPIKEARKKSLSISKFMFFVILSNSYEVLTDVSQARKYARILEPKWKEYIGDEPLYFLQKKWKGRDDRRLNLFIEKLLVYYWKSPSELGNNSFNLLITCQKNRKLLKTWFLAIFSINLLALGLTYYDKIGYDWLLKIWAVFYDNIWKITPVILVISGLLTFKNHLLSLWLSVSSKISSK
jgi:hypothetical protein